MDCEKCESRRKIIRLLDRKCALQEGVIAILEKQIELHRISTDLAKAGS